VRSRSAGAALLTVAALAAAGCGGDDKKDTSGGPSAEAFKPLTIPTDLATKPKIPTTQGFPPEALLTQDVVPGKGKVVKKGDKVQVKYLGVAYSTDKEFDSNWGPADKLFSTQLKEGPGGVIKGWVQGIPGMKEGGRRLLVIPPDLGYGSQGSPPAIAPAETLVFVIDLKKVG
jgi:peptidylprolyl isomerase